MNVDTERARNLGAPLEAVVVRRGLYPARAHARA